MKKQLWLALLLCAALLLSGCSLVVKDPAVDAKQVIVDVNGETVDKKAFIGYYNNALNNEYMNQQMMQQYGQQVNIDPDQVLQQTVDGVVRRMVMLQKAKELKLDTLGAEEQKTLDEGVLKTQKAVWEQIKTAYFADTKLTGDELQKAVEARSVEEGATPERILKDETETLLLNKVQADAVKEVKIEDAAVQADYDAKVAQDKAAYEKDVNAYGDAINNGQTPYFAPGGYRYIKQVLIKFLEADQAAVSAAKQEVSAATTELTAAQQEKTANEEALKAEGLAEDKKKELTSAAAVIAKKISEAQAKVDVANQKLTAAKETGYANIAAKTQDIYTRAKGGEDFAALIKEFNEDAGQPEKGYAVRKGYASFDEAFVNPAMALEKAGEVAEPSKGSFGYYIVQYAAEIPEGAVSFESVRQQIADTLLKTSQNEAFEKTLAEWVAAAQVKTYPERVKD